MEGLAFGRRVDRVRRIHGVDGKYEGTIIVDKKEYREK